MKVTWANLQREAGEDLLDLLHLEADAPLTPQQKRLLDEYQADPDVQAARTALRRAVSFLSGPNPPELPRSVAAEVARDVALSVKLPPPTLPRSVAAEVAQEIRLSQQLVLPDLAHSELGHSVAAAVVRDIQTSRVLGETPLPPASVASAVTAEIQAARALRESAPPLPRSVAAFVAADIRAARTLGQAPLPAQAVSVANRVLGQTKLDGLAHEQPQQQPEAVPPPVPPRPGAALHLADTNALTLPGLRAAERPARNPETRNPAPLLLVGGLLAGLTLLALTTAWPNLAAGATVLRTLLMQVSPLAGLGLLLLLVTSAVITWKPTPTLRTAGAGAFALSAVLTIPALYNVAGGANGLSIGHNVTVSGPVQGNVIAIGGNIHLQKNALVKGEVVTLLGDVHREDGAKVDGHVSALLGRAPGDQNAIQTDPVSSLNVAMSAAAFRPVLGWLGAAAWPRIFVALTGSVLLLLLLAGAAPRLARTQRHAPMRTLAMGVLILSALLLPAAAFGFTGLLTPALLTAALAALLIATGLSVSVYDAGRAVAYRLKLPVPDAVGALLGLSAFAASLSYPPLAFALALIGGTWGAGTLFLKRRTLGGAATGQAG